MCKDMYYSVFQAGFGQKTVIIHRLFFKNVDQL